jgi:hypothetical protein
MKTWKVRLKGSTSSFEEWFQAKFYSTSPGVIILHNGSENNPVAILSIENAYYIKIEEELR